MTTANNVAITLFDIYSKDALENYLGYWKAPENYYEEDEEEEWESEDDDDEENSENSVDEKKKKKTSKGSTKYDKYEDFSNESCSSESSGEDTADPEKAKKLLMKKLEKQSENLVAQISQSIAQGDPMNDAIN